MNVFVILFALSPIRFTISIQQNNGTSDFEPDYYDEDFNNVTIAIPSCVTNGTMFQPMDHDDENSPKWTQRYMLNRKFGNHHSNPPIAFLLVHEHAKFDYYDICFERFPVVIWAKKFGADIFMLEHRFYGPREFSPLAVMPHNEYYPLTANQTLADIHTFMAKMEEIYYGKRAAKWILFGKSYGGTLAAWFNVKYPNRAAGVVASSAPMNFHPDNYEQMWMIESIFYSHSEKCVAEIRTIFNGIAEKFYNGTYGRSQLTRELRLCDDFKDSALEENAQVMFTDLISSFELLAMYGNENIFMLACHIIDEFQYVRYKLNAITELLNPAKECIETRVKPRGMKRAELMWLWERCNGFGLFPTTSGGSTMFGSTVSLNFHISLCRKFFANDYTVDHLIAQEQKLRDTFGTPRHYKGSNTIFTHGEFDIYKLVAFPKEYADKKRNIQVIEIEDAYHTFEMLDVVRYNSTFLRRARNDILKQLKIWLDYKGKSSSTMTIMTPLMFVLFWLL